MTAGAHVDFQTADDRIVFFYFLASNFLMVVMKHFFGSHIAEL